MIDWEEHLNIHTEGIDESLEDLHHNRYESTPYCVLERLISYDYINNNDLFLDYGCGKGRVAFFLNKNIGCKVHGVDYNLTLIQDANHNKNNTYKDVQFYCEKAEKFLISEETCFYFFNPFSESILRKVINNIIHSYYNNPRKIILFFYYPEEDTLSYLMGLQEFICIDQIDCSDLFDNKDNRECIFVFEIY